MKNLITTFWVSIILTFSYSQNYNFEKENYLFVGTGVLPWYDIAQFELPQNNVPLSFKYHRRNKEKYSWGFNLNTYSKEFKYSSEQLKYSTFSFLFRSNFHYGNFSRFDFYSGFGIGIRMGWYNIENPYAVAEYIPLGFELSTGVKYYPTKNIGLYFEVGFTKSVVQVGCFIKF